MTKPKMVGVKIIGVKTNNGVGEGGEEQSLGYNGHSDRTRGLIKEKEVRERAAVREKMTS